MLHCTFAVSHSSTLIMAFLQFRALSDQFYRSPEHHKFVRQQVVRQVCITFYRFFLYICFHPGGSYVLLYFKADILLFVAQSESRNVRGVCSHGIY